MKHATVETLSSLEPLLGRLREIPQLKEKKLGVYYLKSKAFLHFHEDPAGIFVDVRLNPPEFTRLPVNSVREQDALIKAVLSSVS